MESHSLFNMLKFSYPTNTSIALSILKNEGDSYEINVNGLLTKGIFVIGWLSILNFARILLFRKPFKNFVQWLKSFGNAKKQIEIEYDPRK